MRAGRRLAVVAAATVVAGAAGCTGDADGQETSSTTVSPKVPSSSTSSTSSTSGGSETSGGSSASSPTSSGDASTELPPEAKEKTKAGAIAFTKLWFEESGKASDSGDTTTLRDLSSPDCPPCEAFIKRTDRDAANGVTADGNPLTTQGFTARERPDGGYRVQFTLRIKDHDKVDKQGTTAKSVRGSSTTVVTETAWTGQRWELADWIGK